MELYQDEIVSPVGIVYIISDGTNLRAVDFEGYEDRMHRLLNRHYGRYTVHSSRDAIGAISVLTDYFGGDVRAIDGIDVATNGTQFQQHVWSALRAIPAGTTVSYGTIACRIGRPKACRAVGLANRSNPIGIVVPCHRVVGRQGTDRLRWRAREETMATHARGESFAAGRVFGTKRPEYSRIQRLRSWHNWIRSFWFRSSRLRQNFTGISQREILRRL
jgi:methylated-DNA-[protein]-cysteine S-methyltransferase